MSESPGYEELTFTQPQARLAVQATWRDAGVLTIVAYVVWGLVPWVPGPWVLLAMVGTGPAVTFVATVMYRQRRQWRPNSSRLVLYLAGLTMPLWWVPVTRMFAPSGRDLEDWFAIAAAVVLVPAVAVVERTALAAGTSAVGGLLAVLPMLLGVKLSRAETALMIPTVVTMVVAGIAVGNHRYIRSRVVQPGHCRACGYEAGAIGTCPECAGSVEPVGTRVQ